MAQDKQPKIRPTAPDTGDHLEGDFLRERQSQQRPASPRESPLKSLGRAISNAVTGPLGTNVLESPFGEEEPRTTKAKKEKAKDAGVSPEGGPSGAERKR